MNKKAFMKKKSKGFAALALAGALVAGTAGTFAMWFDQAALGAEGDAIVTGDLALGAEHAGFWYWSHVSHEDADRVILGTTNEDGEAVDATQVSDDDVLVPGDGVTFVWADGIDEYIVEGTTLVATLYLDAFGELVNSIMPAPLVVQVLGANGVWAAPVFNDDGTFTIDPILTNPEDDEDNIDEDWVPIWALPQIRIGFPIDRNPNVGDLVNPDAEEGDEDFGLVVEEPGFGHQSGYGRNLGWGVDEDENRIKVIPLDGLTLRLQQIVTDSTVFGG